MLKSILVIPLVMSLTIGCARHPGDKDYVTWVRDYDNSMHVRHVEGGLVYDLQYQPSEYMWMQREGAYDAEAFEKNKAEFEGIHYLTLIIQSIDHSDFIKARSHNEREKQQNLYYFSYLFQNDIRLEQGGEVLPCVLFHFERDVNMNGNRSFVLGFENKGSGEKEMQLIIQSELLGATPVKIKVKKY